MNLNKPREYIYQEFGGFLHIQCECGETKTFYTKGLTTHHICNSCGKRTELGREDMKKATVKCECGRRTTYTTNASTELVEFNCSCGCPNVMQWSNKRKRYVPIREREKHG